MISYIILQQAIMSATYKKNDGHATDIVHDGTDTLSVV